MTSIQATQILRDDHKRLTGLFRQLESMELKDATDLNKMKKGVIREIFMEIEIHSAVEEQIFYPALLAAVNSGTISKSKLVPHFDAAWVDQSISEHREVENLIRRMRRVPIDSADFKSQLEELEELIESHVDEEEQVTFPAAEELLGDELLPLGAQIQDLRDDLLRQPQYQNSTAAIVQNPHGGEQMRTDLGSTSSTNSTSPQVA